MIKIMMRKKITFHRETLVIKCSLAEKPFLTSVYKVALDIHRTIHNDIFTFSQHTYIEFAKKNQISKS